MIPPTYEVFRVVKVTETEIMLTDRCWEKGRMWSQCLGGIEFQVYKIERVQEMDAGDGSA